MFGLLNIRKLILSFLIIIVTILIYIVIVTFVVKVNVNTSLKSLKPHINFSCYNPFKNNLYINGLKLKFEDNTSLYSEINFKKVINMGSVGCKIASIIRGESDIYISLSLPGKSSPKDWDFAAPEAILKAAGGAIT